MRAAFAEVTSPGRLEIVRRSPTIVLDAAHNPHGAEALAAALEDSFSFSPLIGVLGVMADKDHEGLLAALEPHLAHVVCTQNSTPRALPADELAEAARDVFGEDRVTVAPRLADAIDQAAALAEAGEAFGDPLGCRRGAGHRVGRHGRRGPGHARAARQGGPRVSDDRDALAPPWDVRRDPVPRGDHARADHPGDGVGLRRRRSAPRWPSGSG